MAKNNDIKAIKFLGWYFLRVAVGDLDETKPLQWVGGFKGASEKIEIELTGESGQLTDKQIEQIKNDDNIIEIVCDGIVYRLANKDSSLSYRTYIGMDCALSQTVSFSAIYIQLNEEAVNYGHWTKEDKTVAEATQGGE